MKDKQRKSDYIKYKKILKKYKKQLNQINKKANQSPWDYGFGLDYFVTFLHFMKEYYDLGYNVFQVEESSNEIKDTLAETLKAFEEWDDFHMKYFHLDEEDAFDYSETDKGEYYVVPKRAELYEEESLKKYSKEYKKKRDNFFKLLSNNIEKWWD